MKQITEGVLFGTLVAVCIFVGFTMVSLNNMVRNLDRIATAIEYPQEIQFPEAEYEIQFEWDGRELKPVPYSPTPEE